MLKFVKHHMETIIGVEIFPIISFLIFFIFFVVLTLYVFSMRKSEIQELENLPLDLDDNGDRSNN